MDLPSGMTRGTNSASAHQLYRLDDDLLVDHHAKKRIVSQYSTIGSSVFVDVGRGRGERSGRLNSSDFPTAVDCTGPTGGYYFRLSYDLAAVLGV
jgi:hypothetical protein